MAFDILNLSDLSGTLGSLLTGNRSPLAPRITYSGTDVRLYSDDNNTTQVTSSGVTITQKHTFEVEFTPVVLPANLDSFYLFISVHDAQGGTIGLLISSGELALVDLPTGTKKALPNSAGLISVGTKYTLRFVVDGSKNIIDVYLTETALVATDGHQFRYTTGVKGTTNTDGFTISVLGDGVTSNEILLHALRVASTLEVPNRPPVAVAEDVVGTVNQAVQLDGSSSYDPEGAALTFTWALQSVPTGSAVMDSSLFPTYNLTLPGTQDSKPAFIPDKKGVYIVRMTPNDGDIDGAYIDVTVSVQESYIATGYIPDANPILAVLSDFYQHMDGIEILLTYWSTLMQIAAADLLTVLQKNRDKSVSTIGRRMQRRWMDYDCRVELREEFALSLEPGLTGNDGYVPYEIGSDMVSSGTVVLTSATAAFLDANIQVGTTVKLSVAPYRTTVTNVVDQNTIEVADNVPVDTGIEFTVGSNRSFEDTVVTLFTGLTPGAILYISHGGNEYVREVLRISGSTLLVTEELPEMSGAVWRISAFRAETTHNLAPDILVQPGDLGIFDVYNKTSQETTEVLDVLDGSVTKAIGGEPTNIAPFLLDTTTYEVTMVGFYRLRRIPVDKYTEGIPKLQSIIKEPAVTDILEENSGFTIDDVDGQKYITFSTPYTISNLPPKTWWAETTFMSNLKVIEDNFGWEVGLYSDGDLVQALDFDYLSAVTGLMYCLMFGPTIDNLRLAVQIFTGLPYTIEAGQIIKIEDTYTTDLGRITVLGDQSQLLRTYFYRRVLGIDINPATGVAYVEGDRVQKYAPLSLGVNIIDWLVDPVWWNKFGLYEIEKYFLFLVQVDVDAIPDRNKLVETLTEVINFVQQVKPIYTDIIVALRKLFIDEVSVTEAMSLVLTAHFREKICTDSRMGEYGELKSDGTPQWYYGGGLLYGQGEIVCPKDALRLVGSTTGGTVPQYGNIYWYGDPIYYGTATAAGTHTRTMYDSDNIPTPDDLTGV